MDEERRKAYLNLINALLNCPTGEEPQILNANQDLLDAGLLQAMAQVAEFLEKRGDRNAADFLINVARQLAKALTLSSSTPSSSPLPNSDSQLDFLLQVLQATLDNIGNLEAVYPLLQMNLDKLDDNFAHLLHHWATANLSQVKPEEAQRIAEDIGNFSFLIQQFRLGSKDNNLEIAITGHEIAATVFIREAFPEKWAKIQNNLGEAYRNRIRGDKPQNIEKAVVVLQDALPYIPEEFPELRAAIQNNLGLAYRDQEQIEQAIAVHKEALNFYSSKGLSEQWADTQNYLGIAYSDQEQIDEAIAAYEKALTVRSRGTEKWTETQNNLAIVYRKKGQITQAIAIYQDNLKVYTREEFQETWARTQYNLGHAYTEEGWVDNASASYQLALEVFTPTAFPIECFYSGKSLGDMAFNAGRWEEAIKGYGVAIEAVELRRAWASTDTRRQEIQTEAMDAYVRIVQAYIKINQPEKAIEYVERSKARNLVDLLANRDLCPRGASESDCNQLKHLRREITAKQRQMESMQQNVAFGIGEDSPLLNRDYELQEELNQLQQQLNELLDRFKTIEPSFSLTQRVEIISFEKIQTLLPNDKTALIEWYILDETLTFLTFIITRHNPGISVWQSSPEDGQAFVEWLHEYLHYYEQSSKIHWKDNLESCLYRLAEILHLEEVLTHIPDGCDRVILIPHFLLHLLPLHALPLPNQKDKCLLDKFPQGVRYAPSCQLLQLTEKQERPDFSYLFGIQNPTQDLTYANLELQIVRRFFEPAYVLIEKNAKKDAFSTIPHTQHLRAAHCVHFSCHGKFNFKSPVKSALLLADEEPLTLGEIFGLDLSQCRLVTLSACETGINSPNGLSDQYVGLPSGFLYAGALSVVSSLWLANDFSTCFLMIKFYENLRNFPKLEAGEVAIALNQAQIWLRDLTSEEFEAVFTKYQLQIDEILAQLPKGDRFEFQDSLDQARRKIQAPDRQPKPFANPYYWAAFTATGV
ncbi:CHAT domain-containing protein [Microcoleus sp. FACHB-53]|nr:CHAT domain-containing protein [Microcoleus sp. FACHB-53]